MTATFAYDGLGRRKSKTIGGTTTGFWYDGSDVLAELDITTPTVTYIRNLSLDEPFVRKFSTGDEFYVADGLGSAIGLTNGAGASQTVYTYEPFGNTTQSGTASVNPFQYTGRENDGTTRLYYYRARYYSPSSHRFTREDPIGLPGGDPNLYAYVRNSPCNLIDPSGLKCKKPFLRRAFDNFILVNEAVPGLTVPIGTSVATAGLVASRLGLITPMQFALSGFQGLDLGYITLTRGYTAVIASGVALFNFALVSGSYETGLAIGSLIYAGISPCEE